MKKIIYISAHLDDAAYSCGGLIWEQVQSGKHVEIWTICAGQPSEDLPLGKQAKIAHQRWGTDIYTVNIRIKEDKKSCEILGAIPYHFDILDGIYRQLGDGSSLLKEARDFTDPMPSSQHILAKEISIKIKNKIETDEVFIYAPVSLGQHIDHQLTRAAVDFLQIDKVFYPDYPYMRWASDELYNLIPEGYVAKTNEISNVGLEKWIASIEAHESQFSDHFKDKKDVQDTMRAYRDQFQGVRVFKKNI